MIYTTGARPDECRINLPKSLKSCLRSPMSRSLQSSAVHLQHDRQRSWQIRLRIIPKGWPLVPAVCKPQNQYSVGKQSFFEKMWINTAQATDVGDIGSCRRPFPFTNSGPYRGLRSQSCTVSCWMNNKTLSWSPKVIDGRWPSAFSISPNGFSSLGPKVASSEFLAAVEVS